MNAIDEFRQRTADRNALDQQCEDRRKVIMPVIAAWEPLKAIDADLTTVDARKQFVTLTVALAEEIRSAHLDELLNAIRIYGNKPAKIGLEFLTQAMKGDAASVERLVEKTFANDAARAVSAMQWVGSVLNQVRIFADTFIDYGIFKRQRLKEVASTVSGSPATTLRRPSIKRRSSW
jgi:hypothetical protein